MPVRLVTQIDGQPSRFVLTAGDNLIGSGPDCQVTLPDPSVSRRHAVLRVDGQRIELQDLGSRNGTRIGSRRVRDSVRVMDGTTIQIGGVLVVVERVAEEDTEPAIEFASTGATQSGPPGSPARTSVETASLTPVASFLLDSFPRLVGMLEGSRSIRSMAELTGKALLEVLPACGIEIVRSIGAASDPLYLAEYPQTLKAAAGDPIEARVGSITIKLTAGVKGVAQIYEGPARLAAALIDLAGREPVAFGSLLRRSTLDPPPLPEPASKDPTVQGIYARASCVARGNLSVLIRGESGTGKEILAGYIHAASERRDRDLIVLNCAALPRDLLEAELFGVERGTATGVTAREGILERAHLGTIFLDEVGDMASSTQAKLLRVLQEGEVFRLGGKEPRPAQGRVIAATNRDLDRLVDQGQFRLDLFHRIAGWQVELPPLRHRRVDLPALAGHFLLAETQRLKIRVRGISRGAMEAMLAYEWPGNIRQLRAEMTRVALTMGPGELLDRARLDPAIAQASAPGSLKDRLRCEERRHIADTLTACAGDLKEAAERLRISGVTLYRRLKSLEIPTDRS